MRPLREHEDAFGRALLDHLEGHLASEIVERSDGYIDVSAPAGSYFAPIAVWRGHDRRAAELARGRVLDIGCGAGRFALHLQERGHDVVGIDISPLAIEVCRRRGLRDARILSITAVTRQLGTFDTVLMMGNNFGLFGSPARAKRLLRRFHRMTAPDARIIAETLDPSRTEDPAHIDYQASNRRRGRAQGQIRIRVRYKRYTTPWFDYLFVSPDELAAIVHGTGWGVSELIMSEGPVYVALLEKD
jgi:SAM-dependent methyltransferase